MSKKRPLDGFFKPQEAKKAKIEVSNDQSNHKTYPFPVPHLPPSIQDRLGFAPDEVNLSVCS
jgi:hypothetical protein